RLLVLHRLREPQGSRAGCEPARGARLLLAGAAPAGPRHGHGHPRAPRGVGDILPQPPAGEPTLGVGFAPERGRAEPRGARGAPPRGRGALPGRRRAPPRPLGRLCPRPRGDRVLAGTPGPPPRPTPLHP